MLEQGTNTDHCHKQLDEQEFVVCKYVPGHVLKSQGVIHE